MGHLGDFGTPRPAHEDTFGYFGVELRVHPDLSDIAVIQLFAAMDTTKDGAGVVGGLEQVAQTLVHVDDVDAFWRLVRTNRQSMQDLAAFAMELVSAITDRPTGLPADSSDGQSSTGTRSEDDSSSAAAVRLLPGRPDLQVAVIRADLQAAV